MPKAVVRGHDGYLRVYYDRLGVTFETYDKWVASGARVPSSRRMHRRSWTNTASVEAGGDRGANARYQNK